MTDEEMISEEKKKIAFIDTASTIHPNTLEDDLNYYENFLIPGLQEQIEKQEKERAQLLVENQKKEKIIDLMAEKIDNFRDELDMLRNFEKDCFIPREYSDIDDCIKKESCKQCIIEYFSKKVGE